MTAVPDALYYYQIDAFTTEVFGGNPAAVIVLEAWPHDALLTAIAAEHNLSETAFIVPGAERHELRWFTPSCEVELCGHGTLASAYVLLECMSGYTAPLRFATRHAGELGVARRDGLLWLDFPRQPIEAATPPPALVRALGRAPSAWRLGPNHLAVFDNAQDVAALAPDLRALAAAAATDNRGLIATAPAADGVHDFVSRYFAPHHGVDEDPVTGSAHCMLAPYWGARLGRDTLRARQISARGGTLACELHGERVHLGGHAVRYAEGRLFLSERLATV